MKIAFISENGIYGQKIASDYPHMRTDFAWIVALDATHLNVNQLLSGNSGIAKKEFDIAIFIPPKNMNINIDVIDGLRKFTKKIAIMQEGPSWHFQDKDDILLQFQHIQALQSTDFLFCHNEVDRMYYSTYKDLEHVYVLPPVMIEDNIKQLSPPTGRKGIMLGGNFSRWYGAIDSLSVAQKVIHLDEEISIPTMGRAAKNEHLYYKKIDHMNWTQWMTTLNEYRVGVHFMPTVAAGTFALNCAFLGIPCFGYSQLDTQRICHPFLSFTEIFYANKYIDNQIQMHDYDLHAKLWSLGRDAKRLYELNFSEYVFKSKIKSILEKYI